MRLRRILPQVVEKVHSHRIGEHAAFVEGVLWDPVRRRLLSSGLHGEVVCRAFQPTGEWDVVATASPDLSASGGRLGITGFLRIGSDRVLVYGRPNVAGVLSLSDLTTSHVLAGHTDSIICAAVDAKTGRILTGSNDQTVRCWDAERGALLWTSPPQAFWICGVAWLPDGDAAAVVLHGPALRIRDGRVVGTIGPETVSGRAVCVDAEQSHLWIGEVGQVTAVPLGHGEVEVREVPGECVALVPIPDVDAVLFAGEDGTVGVLDIEDFHAVGSHRGNALGVRPMLNAQGRLKAVMSWGLDQRVCVWSRRGLLLDQHTDHANLVKDAVTFDGNVITASSDHTLRLWRPVLDRTEALTTRTRGRVNAVRFLDADTLMSTNNSEDGGHIWALPDPRPIHTLHDTAELVDAVLLGDQVVAPAEDGTVRFMSRDGAVHARAGWPGIRDMLVMDDGSGDVVFASEQGPVWRAHVPTKTVRWYQPMHGDDTFRLVSCAAGLLCPGVGVTILDPDTGAVVRIFKRHPQPVQIVRMLDEERAISLSRKGSRAWVWSVHTGEVMPTQLPHGPKYVDLHVRGDRLYVTLNGGALEEWPLDLSGPLARIPLDQNGYVYPSLLQSTPRYLAVHHQGTVRRMERTAIQTTEQLRTANSNWQSEYVMDSDGRIGLITGLEMKLFDEDGAVLAQQEGEWSGALFVGDGLDRIFVAGEREMLAIDVHTRAVRWRVQTPHKRSIQSMVALHDPDQILSADLEGRVCVWDRATGSLAQTLGGMNGEPQGIVSMGADAITWSKTGDVMLVHADASIGWVLRTGHELRHGTAAGERHVLIAHQTGALLISDAGEVVDEVKNEGWGTCAASNAAWASVGTSEGEVWVWDCRAASSRPTRVNAAVEGTYFIGTMAWHPTQPVLISSMAGQLARWTPERGWSPFAAMATSARYVAVTRSGAVAVCLRSGLLMLLDADGQEQGWEMMSETPTAMAQHADLLAAGDHNGNVYVWVVEDGADPHDPEPSPTRQG